MGRFDRKIERAIMRALIDVLVWLLLAPFKLIAWLFTTTKRPATYINSNGYVVLKEFNELEHRHIAKQHLGRNLHKNEIVHHINGKRTDNWVNNLCLMDRQKHEHFHAWLRWKKEKSGRYPSINDQKRVLEQEYGGKLLEKIKPTKPARRPEQIAPRKSDELAPRQIEPLARNERISDDSEIFVIRRNKATNKIFVEFDDVVLISPDGKDVELDAVRFGEPEEVTELELTEQQIKAVRHKEKAIESESIEEDNRSDEQRRLFNELRKERKRLAIENGVPAYIVFDDKTLMEMSEIMPESEALMLKVKGVGPEKFRMYGPYFIEVVKKFKSAG